MEFRIEGILRGFNLADGTNPARALYIGALEVTKSSIRTGAVVLGFPDTTSIAIASDASGLSSAMAAQLV
ncbi:hypothetical protein V6N11_066893 [Hibiscus sabdariffa]|uniref:Uncharacterized protein n=1 Tax=Hibiscus sabdariffa TaxID=183260 RepID=A0ABR2SPH3_9ROSI